MANPQHLELLKAGREIWNAWKDSDILIRPDFKNADLDGMDLSGYHLDQSDFTEASMQKCNLNDAWLCWCIFIRTDLKYSTIIRPDRDEISGDRRLLGVNLRWSSFAQTDLEGVNLHGATLESASFHDCNFKGANISEADVYGVSAWGNIFDENSKQEDLVVSKFKEDLITIDNLELAQFIYLLLRSEGVRSAINSLVTKVVLILGSFAVDDLKILESIKRRLRQNDFVPMIYNFEKPQTRNHTETVSAIAHLANFIVADLTNPRSIPNELAAIVPRLRSVPLIPIIRDGQKPFGMFQDFQDLPCVGPLIEYEATTPINELVSEIIQSAKSIMSIIHR